MAVPQTAHCGRAAVRTRVQEQFPDRLRGVRRRPWFLTKRQWRCLRLHVKERRTYAAIAARDGVPPSDPAEGARRAAALFGRWEAAIEQGARLGLAPETPPALAEVCLALDLPPAAAIRWALEAGADGAAVGRIAEATGVAICRPTFINWRRRFLPS